MTIKQNFLGDVTVDVLVVGAGPAGFMAAVTLARYGVSFGIIDQRPLRIQTGHAGGKSSVCYLQLSAANSIVQRGVQFLVSSSSNLARGSPKVNFYRRMSSLYYIIASIHVVEVSNSNSNRCPSTYPRSFPDSRFAIYIRLQGQPRQRMFLLDSKFCSSLGADTRCS